MSRGGGLIYTLGTSTRAPEEFLRLLKALDIEVVVDVRRFPTSRWDYFKRENLAPLLAGEGIDYLHLGGELGGYRSGGYRSFMASAAFEKGLRRLEGIAQGAKAAILCAERLPWRCHRRFIAEGLVRRGWRVCHVIDADRCWEAKAG